MKLIGPDGGDGLRSYLRDIGSTSVHPLLTGWVDKLEQYRTGIDGFAHYWGEWFDYCAEMTAFLARGYDAILCPAYIHPALPLGTSILDEKLHRLQSHHGLQRRRLAGRGCALRRVGYGLAHRRSDSRRAMARRCGAGGGVVAGTGIWRMEAAGGVACGAITDDNSRPGNYPAVRR